MKRVFRHSKGFTLLEMLLVLVIISAIIYMLIGYYQQQALTTRMDKTAQQMQQILNAGLAYYVDNGQWPDTSSNDITCLQGSGSGCSVIYLPPAFNSPFAEKYKIAVNNNVFYVYTKLKTSATQNPATVAQIIAGKLPLSYTTTDSGNPPTSGSKCTAGSTCSVVASVNVPGQNLNNASAINFAGLYHHGGCVPVPSCPVDKNGNTMKPQIMVVPVSVSGVSDPNDPTKVYPISSFTAYATNPDTGGKPDLCNDSSDVEGGQDCTSSEQGKNPNSAGYWRVCLQVYTQEGEVAQTNDKSGSDAWGQYVTLLAITRCAISNEPSGSGFTVYSN